MNERIGELAEQARDYTDSLISSSGWANGDEIFEEKFAELIVKECARIIETRAPGQLGKGGWTNGFDDGLNTGAFLIKKHFGVE